MIWEWGEKKIKKYFLFHVQHLSYATIIRVIFQLTTNEIESSGTVPRVINL